MKILLYSFGYKHAPPEADLVLDVRFLPNPYWVAELKPYTGRDPQVALYALDNEAGRTFFHHLEPFLLFLFDQYAGNGRETVTLAIGCTGGRHRSVAVVEHLRCLLGKKAWELTVRHRDIEKE